MLANYNPRDVIITFGPWIITGYAEGSFVTVERQEDTWSLKVGADGDSTRVKNNNRSGHVKLTLTQVSPANDYLAASAVADELNGSGVQPVLVKDRNGTTLCAAGKCWVKKPASVQFGKDASDREWTLETNDLVIFPGGVLPI
jgi:hypothetical protein